MNENTNFNKEEQLALYGMIAGIVSCVFCACGCIVPVAAGTAGIVMSSLAIKKLPQDSPHRTKALVGIITGAAGIVLGIIVVIVSILMYAGTFAALANQL